MEAIKKLHGHLIVTGLYRYSSPMTKVLSSYALSSTNLTHAHLVFEQIEEPNTYTWNTMIRGLAQSDAPKDAIFFYNRMREQGRAQDNLTFPFVLKACARIPAIGEGKRMHSHGLKLGLVSDVFISNALIHLYASCGDLSCARLVFDEMPVRDLVSWNSLICGYSQNHQLREVLRLFEAMQKEGAKGDKVTMVKVVSACTHLGEWDLAESVVKYMEENGVEVDVYLGNTLIDYYGRRGSVEAAKRVFSEMKERNIVTLNAMITTYAKAGDLVYARRIFDSMPERDLISWSSMITGYSQANHFSEALVLFRQMQKAKLGVGELKDHHSLPLSTPKPLGSMPWLTKSPFHLRTTSFAPLNSSLSLCICPPTRSIQSQPHPTYEHHLLSLLLKHQTKRHPSIQVHSQLLTTAFHHQQIDETGMRIWNNLIRSYSLGCYPKEAILVYQQMQELCCSPLPTDTFTFAFLLKACAHLSQASAGIQFHGLIIKKGFEFNVYAHTSLLDMYATCGYLVEARRVFVEMPERNLVAWNAMITGYINWNELGLAGLLFKQMPARNVISWTCLIDGYTRAHRPKEAFACFGRMMAEGINPTEITVLAIVPAISNFGALNVGESLHGYCEKHGLGALDVRVVNSLIDMYAKCGSIENSLKAFQEMHSRRNLVSWTTIISGFAMHGMAKEVVRLFEEMGREKVKPNKVTFLSVLNACSHGGLVEEGIGFFRSMVHEHGIEPEIKHYGCMIDMLGRVGRLVEAEEMIVGMPMEVNVIVWRTLLGCCCKHGDVEMGERVMRRILELEKGYGGDYVVLSNLLTEVGRFDDAERVRRLIDERNVLKVPGLSSIGAK